ncbi:MAG TPA: PepSY-associated TM helix domain-containing protein, partial [Acidobacteriota bacterium]
FWLHLFTGCSAGLIIFVMCVTGSMLGFEKQITRFSERNRRVVDFQPGAKKLPMAELLSRVKEQNGILPDGISIQSNPESAVMFMIGRESVLYLNPYTGNILGGGSTSVRKLFRTVTNIHRWLTTGEQNREAGRSITGVCNAAFLLLATSGLYLWWPNKWHVQKLRGITWFQRKLRGRARDFNWHNTIGFWCAPVLIVLTLSGLIMSYQWANNLLYSLSGSEKPSLSAGNNRPGTSSNQNEIPDNLEDLMARAQTNFPGWKTITMRIPAAGSSSVTFAVEANESINPFARSEITLNSKTGETIKKQSYNSNNSGRKLRIWARGLHTGEALRVPGQIAAFIASTGGAFLVFTGLSLALRRLKKYQQKQTNIRNYEERYQNLV